VYIREHCSIPVSKPIRLPTDPNPSIRQCMYSDDTKSPDMAAKSSSGRHSIHDSIDQIWDVASGEACHEELRRHDPHDHGVLSARPDQKAEGNPSGVQRVDPFEED
jgi:hypothetical protein